MVNDELIEGFFVEDEEKFNTDKVLSLINRIKKFATLVGKNGVVEIHNKNLTNTDKTKIFLIVRYLGSELAKLKEELGIDPNMAEVTTDDFAKFIDRDKFNAGARMSALVKEGFASKLSKGKIKVKSFMIERFITHLEKPSDDTQKGDRSYKKSKKKVGGTKTVTKNKTILPEFEANDVYQRLSKNLGVGVEKLKDVLFFIREGIFKFDNIPGKSKSEEQRNCMVLTGYTLLIGLGITKFKSQIITKVAFESGMDISGLKDTIKYAKKKGYITKAGTGTQDNILKDKGKQEAIKVFKDMCS